MERDLIPLAQHAPQKFGDKLKTLVQLIGVFCRILRSSIKVIFCLMWGGVRSFHRLRLIHATRGWSNPYNEGVGHAASPGARLRYFSAVMTMRPEQLRDRRQIKLARRFCVRSRPRTHTAASHSSITGC